MKVTDVYLSGLGVFQPPTVDAGQAARRGEYDPGAYLENRLTGVCVAGDISPPEMAVHAARQALSRAGGDPARIGMVMHATTFVQGPEGWHAPSYIQKEIVGNASPALEIRLGCNGMFAGLELAAPRLGAMEPDETVLLTAAENLGSPVVDRWNGMSGFLQGDTASALLLGRESGFAQLRAVGTVAVPQLEQLMRGGEPLYPPSAALGKKVDMASRAMYFRDNVMSLNAATEELARAMAEVVERTLHEADRKLDDMTRVLYGNAAGYIVQQLVLEPLGIAMDRTTWQFGRGIGHSGPNDQILSLNHLLTTGQLAVGDHVLLTGGAAAMVSSAVLEIVDVPAWTRA
ncbi:MAG TPA: ketoacyl-ACP synthase III family protein [Streptosporangiaceae bacterium]|nr:ketoacyl-ACP synthase III family protein [Streptosporangiaceae bacterium]